MTIFLLNLEAILMLWSMLKKKLFKEDSVQKMPNLMLINPVLLLT